MTTIVELPSQVVQILSVGWLWTFFHCSPMCGPIVSGLEIGKNGIVKGLFLYQAGRAIVYLLFGAAAGWIGSAKLFDRPALGWILVAVFLLMCVWQWKGTSSDWIPNSIFQNWARLNSKISGTVRPLVLGVLLGFLPCMLSFWALGLAAATRSPLYGMLVMLILIIFTILPLFVSLITSRFVFGRAQTFSKMLLPLSTIWIFLATCASNDLISHFHYTFELFGRNFVLMFW